MYKKINLRNVATIVACLAASLSAFTLFGCKDFASAFSDETEIISFTFSGIEDAAVIDKSARTVEAVAAASVDLTQLVVLFELSEGAVATVDGRVQQSGVTANDFSKTVVYAVTSGSEEYTRDWKVTVTQEEGSEEPGEPEEPEEPSGEFAYTGKTLTEWVLSLNFSLDFKGEILDPSQPVKLDYSPATVEVKAGDYLYNYLTDTKASNLRKNDEWGGCNQYFTEAASDDAKYSFYYCRKYGKADVEGANSIDNIWRLNMYSFLQNALKIKQDGHKVIQGIKGKKVGSGKVAGQNVDIYEENYRRYYVIPESGLCLRLEYLTIDKKSAYMEYSVTRYSTTLSAIDTERQIFDKMQTKGVQFRVEDGFGLGHIEGDYNSAENTKWPTEYMNRYADMEPMPQVPAYTGNGTIYDMMLQFDWDANSWINYEGVSQADCNAYIEALRSAGWTNENAASGTKVFDATNIPDGSENAGLWIWIEYANGRMLIHFQKVNERRKPWILYV